MGSQDCRNIVISENYTINLTRIAQSIVFVQNRGDLSEFDAAQYNEIMEQFLIDMAIVKPFVEIRSFARLKGTASKTQIKKHLSDLERRKEDFKAIYFCETPFWMAPLSQIGYRRLKKYIVFEIVSTIDEAIEKASIILNQKTEKKKIKKAVPNGKSFRIKQKDLEEIITYGTDILWEEQGEEVNNRIDNKNPLKSVGDILEMIYKDLRELRSEESRRSNQIMDILNQIDVAVLLIEPEEKIVLFANKSASMLCGIPEKELTGKPCLGIFCSNENKICPRGSGVFSIDREEDQFENRRKQNLTVLKTATPLKVGNKEIQIVTMQNISPIKTVEEEKSRAYENLKNHKKMLLSIMEDTEIAHRNTQELNRKITAREELLKLSMTVAGLGIWELDLRKGKVNFSPEFYMMTGYEVNGFPQSAHAFRNRVHPEDYGAINQRFFSLVRGEAPAESLEFRFRRSDGQYMWLQMRNKLIGEDRENAGTSYIGTFSDITDKKVKEYRIDQLNKLQTSLLEQIPISEKYNRITMTVYDLLQCDIAAIWLFDPGEIRCSEGCLFSNGKRRYSRCGRSFKCLKLEAFSSSLFYSAENLTRMYGTEFDIDLALLSGLKKIRSEISEGNPLIENDSPLQLNSYVLIDGEQNSIGVLAFFSRTDPDNEEDFYLETVARLTSQVIQNDQNTRELRTALEHAERANTLMEGRESRIRAMKGEINRLSRESGREEVYGETDIESDKSEETERLISPEESKRNALSLVEDAEIARRETLETNEQLTLIKQAVNNSTDAIGISTVSGDFFYINKTFTGLLGFTIKRLAELPTDLLFDETDIVAEILRTVEKGSSWQGRVHVFDESNRIIPVFLRTSIFKDENEITLGLIWTMTDIREQLESEKQIESYTKTIERDLAEKKEMLSKATVLQKSFIQKHLPILQRIAVKALFLPCETLGGDFFRIVSNRYENKLCIIIGDCTDHGLKASMDASLLSSLIDPHIELLVQGRTGQFLRNISRDFSEMADDDQFPTMTAMVIDQITGESRYSNANGELPFLIRKNEIRKLEKSEGMHIAYMEDPEYEAKSFLLEPGDRLLFFSDALPEMKIDEKNRLGYSNLIEILKEVNGTNKSSFYSLIDRMEAINGKLPLEDDLTLISLQFRTPIERSVEYSREAELGAFIETIIDDLKDMDFSDDEIGRTDIALREMYLNAFHHGNKGDENRHIKVRSHIDCSGYTISLEDQGEGFNREQIKDPVENIAEILKRDNEKEYTHGRGIIIAEHFTDSLQYNTKGNKVYLNLSRKENRVQTYS